MTSPSTYPHQTTSGGDADDLQGDVPASSHKNNPMLLRVVTIQSNPSQGIKKLFRTMILNLGTRVILVPLLVPIAQERDGGSNP